MRPALMAGRAARERVGRSISARKREKIVTRRNVDKAGMKAPPLNRQIEGQAMSGNYPSSAPDLSKVCRGEDEDPSTAPLIG